MEIKICPFCGGEALLRERYISGIANTKHYRRECRHCKATFANWYRSIKKADEAWNRRADPENKPLTLSELYDIDNVSRKRMTVSEALQHPWISVSYMSLTTQLDAFTHSYSSVAECVCVYMFTY